MEVVVEECIDMRCPARMPTISDCTDEECLCNAIPKQSIGMKFSARMPTSEDCTDGECVCNANPKSRKVESKPSMVNNVWCTVCLQNDTEYECNDTECECNAKPKSRKVKSKPLFRIHTTSKGKSKLDREEGSLLQEDSNKAKSSPALTVPTKYKAKYRKSLRLSYHSKMW